MFTGIIEQTGKILSLQELEFGKELMIGADFSSLKMGESIAVDGVCLSVCEFGVSEFKVQASYETLQRTTLGNFAVGQSVHLERALKMEERFGGHFVLGHVDGVLNLKSKTAYNQFTELEFDGVSEKHQKYLIEKGCIALNGVSFTVNEVIENSFKICMIPLTAELTHFKFLKEGSKVNVEYDYLIKAVKA